VFSDVLNLERKFSESERSTHVSATMMKSVKRISKVVNSSFIVHLEEYVCFQVMHSFSSYIHVEYCPNAKWF
jgi:hypothetical protein